jgi:hypothetical protein
VRRRRGRNFEDLMRDPHFHYQVGRLIGAGEMAGHWMSLQKEEQTKEMGAKLQETVGWFFIDEEHKASPPTEGVDMAGRENYP